MSNTNQNSGCLTAIFNIFKKTTATPRPTDTFTKTTLEPDPEEKLPYRTRDDFFSHTELSFYHVLKSIIGTRLTILAKVRLTDIFYITRPNENYSYHGKIAQKHIDFLICRPKTMKPIMAIELDDASHNRSDRIERDEFVDKVFETAELPLIRVPAQRTYNTQEITSLLKNALPQQPSEVGETKKEHSSANPLLCPKCNEPMVIRTANKGKYKGSRFYGCPNFPKCRQFFPILEQNPSEVA